MPSRRHFLAASTATLVTLGAPALAQGGAARMRSVTAITQVFGDGIRLTAAAIEYTVAIDGAENAEQSLAQFRFFEPWFRPGSVLAMHDWNTEKMRLVRQLLARSPQWRETLVLADPDSIGFAFYELV